MSEELTDLLVGGYGDLVSAHRDFDAVVTLVKAKQVKVQGVILVAHDQDGEVTVVSTGDHLGRKGLGWGAGVGVVVGLFAPELLASVAVGAVGGAIVGRFAEHKIKTGLHDKLGQALPAGTAGDHCDLRRRISPGRSSKPCRERPCGRWSRRTRSGFASSRARWLRRWASSTRIAPDCRSPIPNFGGAIGRTMDKSVPDWSINMTPKPPEGAPNVLLVLIDDAGFGNPSTFGGPVATPSMTRVANQGLTFNRFHVTALCSPTRAAMLTGRNHHRVGFGSIGELPGPFPGYTAAVPKDCAPFVRALQGNGYSTGGFGKWHMTPDHVQGAAGPFDRWPNSWGFDHFWGLLGGEAGQYDPLITQDQTTIGVPRG